MAETFAPDGSDALVEILSDAAASRTGVAVRGGASSGATDRVEAPWILETRQLAGIVDYDPDELVVTARAGTPLKQLQELLAEWRQIFAFDPYDAGPLHGRDGGNATIGGIVSSGNAGPRRVTAGAARDHLLGFTAVSGRGELFKAGGRVVKNVTGFDLPKVFAGAWGTLGVLETVTLRTLPAPRHEATLILRTDTIAAGRAMQAALGHSGAVSCAAHTSAGTLLRLEGFPPSVTARLDQLAAALRDFGDAEHVEGNESRRLWDSVRMLDEIPAETALWRISVAPADGAPLLDMLREVPTAWLLDWGGARLWLGVADADDAQAAAIRPAVARFGGQAVLVRASDAVRAAAGSISIDPALRLLGSRVRAAFDPHMVLNPGLDIWEL